MWVLETWNASPSFVWGHAGEGREEALRICIKRSATTFVRSLGWFRCLYWSSPSQRHTVKSLLPEMTCPRGSQKYFWRAVLFVLELHRNKPCVRVEGGRGDPKENTPETPTQGPHLSWQHISDDTSKTPCCTIYTHSTYLKNKISYNVQSTPTLIRHGWIRCCQDPFWTL